MVYVFERDTSDKLWVQELISEGKEVYFLNGSGLKDIILLNDIIKEHQIKIIHTHFTGIRHHLLFSLLKNIIRSDIVIIRHLHNHYEGKSYPIDFLKNTLASVDLYIGCSQSVAEYHRYVNKLAHEKVTYVTNAIDFARLTDYEILDRQSLSIDAQTKVFLVFGFDFYRKGVDIVLDAIERVIKNNFKVCLLLSLSTNKELVSSIITQKYGHIPFWVKLVDAREDIATYYRSSDAFISSSRSEGFCYSLVEAAYCGIPIIASDIPGQNSLNIPNTFQFNSQDILSLEQQIHNVLTVSEEQKLSWANIQKSYVIRTFDLDAWAEKIWRIYESYFISEKKDQVQSVLTI